MAKARMPREIRELLIGSLVWGLTSAGLNALPAHLRPACMQLTAAIVVAFAWRLGAAGGLLHGLAAGTVSILLFLNGMLPTMAGGGDTGAVIGTGMLVVIGITTGVLSDRVKGFLVRRKESEERYVLAARGANDGLWDWDLRTDRVYYSERWCEILGYSPGEVAGTPEDWLDRIHPSDVDGVRGAVQAHIRAETQRYENEHRIRRQDGSWTWVLTRGICTRGPKGRPQRMTGWLTDISERKHTEERLRHYAFHDALTGLPNRALFMDRVQHSIARLRRQPDQRLAIVMLDLDRFKNINDSMGHLAGDELLCQVARRLESCIRSGDTLARLGGDEFTILMEDVEAGDGALATAELIQRTISAPMELDGQSVVTSASIGVAVSVADRCDPISLLRDADQAMYGAKRQGKGQQVLYDASVHDETSQRLSLETSLRTAIDTDAMQVHYQPIIDLKQGEICGFEALARWDHPTLGSISPREFIPVAEETGLIGKLGEHVLKQALSSLEEWQGPSHPALSMGVNVSLSELADDDWLKRAAALMEEHDLSARHLHVDVKESSLMQSSGKGQRAFEAMRGQGIQIHMDDFGTGYSSLSYLHRFPLDALKVDGSFVGQLHQDTGAEEIVRAVVSLGRDLGLRVIAEGVERPEQLARLRELGCDAAQGFYFGAPASRSEISALLRTQPKW